ncbi:MAG: ketose-bisphosphate aldolase [Flexilinea sp.]
MLVTLKEILADAEEKKCAVGSFNSPNLATLLGVLKAAGELKTPIIIQHAQAHEPAMPLDVIGPIMLYEAAKASIPVCVHLDHGVDFPYLEKALELGFTSIMYDGSSLSFEQNILNTRKAVAMAAQKNASVEAEFGVMTGGEGSVHAEEGGSEDLYTDPDLAKKFVDETGIDALACSFGTVHGIYLREPKLDFDRVLNIRNKIGLPIVMHGGSGVSHDDYRKVISRGVRKINYYSYMARAGVDAVRSHLAESKGSVLFETVESWAMQAMYEDAKKTIKVFSESQPVVL